MSYLLAFWLTLLHKQVDGYVEKELSASMVIYQASVRT